MEKLTIGQPVLVGDQEDAVGIVMGFAYQEGPNFQNQRDMFGIKISEPMPKGRNTTVLVYCPQSQNTGAHDRGVRVWNAHKAPQPLRSFGLDMPRRYVHEIPYQDRIAVGPGIIGSRRQENVLSIEVPREDRLAISAGAKTFWVFGIKGVLRLNPDGSGRLLTVFVRGCWTDEPGNDAVRLSTFVDEAAKTGHQARFCFMEASGAVSYYFPTSILKAEWPYGAPRSLSSQPNDASEELAAGTTVLITRPEFLVGVTGATLKLLTNQAAICESGFSKASGYQGEVRILGGRLKGKTLAAPRLALEIPPEPWFSPEETVEIAAEMGFRRKQLRGLRGKVVLLIDRDGDVGIEFLEDLGAGSLDGAGKDGHCLYIPAKALKKVAE